jgi:hypothetical protein
MPAAGGGKSKMDTQQSSSSKKGKSSEDDGTANKGKDSEDDSTANKTSADAQDVKVVSGESIENLVGSSSRSSTATTAPTASPTKRVKLSASQMQKVTKTNKSATLSTNREYWSVSGAFYLTSVKFLTEQQSATLLNDESLKSKIGIAPFTPSIVNGAHVQQNTVAAYRNFTKEQVTCTCHACSG